MGYEQQKPAAVQQQSNRQRRRACAPRRRRTKAVLSQRPRRQSSRASSGCRLANGISHDVSRAAVRWCAATAGQNTVPTRQWTGSGKAADKAADRHTTQQASAAHLRLQAGSSSHRPRRYGGAAPCVFRSHRNSTNSTNSMNTVGNDNHQQTPPSMTNHQRPPPPPTNRRRHRPAQHRAIEVKEERSALTGSPSRLGAVRPHRPGQALQSPPRAAAAAPPKQVPQPGGGVKNAAIGIATEAGRVPPVCFGS